MRSEALLSEPAMLLPYEKLKEFCERNKVVEMALFGSVLRDDFRSDSDVDIVVTFSKEAHYSLFDLYYLRKELEQILGREVDLVEKEGLVNPFRRREILSNMRVVYAA